jgi:hypothetical protein
MSSSNCGRMMMKTAKSGLPGQIRSIQNTCVAHGGTQSTVSWRGGHKLLSLNEDTLDGKPD